MDDMERWFTYGDENGDGPWNDDMDDDEEEGIYRKHNGSRRGKRSLNFDIADDQVKEVVCADVVGTILFEGKRYRRRISRCIQGMLFALMRTWLSPTLSEFACLIFGLEQHRHENT